jgi:hypothetical protein
MPTRTWTQPGFSRKGPSIRLAPQNSQARVLLDLLDGVEHARASRSMLSGA